MPAVQNDSSPAQPLSMLRAPSLRIQLLKALAAPLFALVLASGIVAYWLAVHYTNEVFDRALYDSANNLAQQVRIANNQPSNSLASLAEGLMNSEDTAVAYWRVEGPQGLLAGQDVWLGFGSGHQSYRNARLYYAWHNGKQVRAVQMSLLIDTPLNQIAIPYSIEVAELLDKRQLAARQILLAVSVPLFILLALGGIIISVILTRELVPLQRLADSLNHQSAKSLENLDEQHVPAEIRPLTHAMNALLARLRESLDAQRKFIADAAHQLRTPLTALKLHADRAALAQDFPTVKFAVQELQTSANRAVRLSNQLLSLARAEPDAQRAEFTRLDLHSLVFDLGAEWVPRALEKNIDLGFATLDPAQPMDTPIWVAGHSVLLREALSNLIDNAIKYVPKAHPTHGQITLYTGLDTARQQALVVVEDNGPGIPLAQREEVFQRFFRADYQGVGGAGLGLAIVRDIVTLHGGTITITDRPEMDGEIPAGMRFALRFPAV